MLLMPGGQTGKKTESLTLEEMDWLARGEHMCRKLNLTIACPNCLRNGSRQGAILRGGNDERDQRMSVQCDCRLMTFSKDG